MKRHSVCFLRTVIRPCQVAVSAALLNVLTSVLFSFSLPFFIFFSPSVSLPLSIYPCLCLSLSIPATLSSSLYLSLPLSLSLPLLTKNTLDFSYLWCPIPTQFIQTLCVLHTDNFSKAIESARYKESRPMSLTDTPTGL